MIGVFKTVQINAVNRFRAESAFFGENWANMLSTIMFTLTSILTINFLFDNIFSLGSFSKDELLFQILIGQLVFYILGDAFRGAIDLQEDINNGNLDFIFVRPVRELTHLFTQRMSFVRTMRDSIPALFVVLIAINWSMIEIQYSALVPGVLIFTMLIVADFLFTFSLALIAFWTGSGRMTTSFFWAAHDESRAPFEITPGWFKRVVSVLAPGILNTLLVASILLGKLPVMPWIIIASLVMIGWIVFFKFLWAKAKGVYASASS